jgi:hypothetical protein
MTQQSPELRVKTGEAELVSTGRYVSQVNCIGWNISGVTGNGVAEGGVVGAVLTRRKGFGPLIPDNGRWGLDFTPVCKNDIDILSQTGGSKGCGVGLKAVSAGRRRVDWYGPPIRINHRRVLLCVGRDFLQLFWGLVHKAAVKNAQVWVEGKDGVES